MSSHDDSSTNGSATVLSPSVAHSPPTMHNGNRVGMQSPPATLPPLTEAEKKKQGKEKKLREQRRRHEEVGEREASAPQRRTIPTAPHRQLFLVDNFYCVTNLRGSQEEHQQHEALIGEEWSDNRVIMGSSSGAGGMSGPGADPAALTNRIGIVPNGPSFGLSGAGSSQYENMIRRNGLLFYISPLAHPALEVGNDNTNNNNKNHSGDVSGGGGGNYSHVASPSTSSASPQGDGSSVCKSRKSRKLKKRHIKWRFHEPVELQVESISAFVIRLVLILWYAVLITSLVIEVIPRVQWSVVNICGAGYPADLRHVEKWSSPCVSSTPMLGSSAVVLTWPGSNLDHLHAKLVRYRRIVVSLPTPADQVNSVEDYDLMASTTMETGGLTWTSNRTLSLRCQKKNKRCDLARVPEDMLGATRSSTSFTFALQFVSQSLAAAAANGAVGVSYQRSSYTVATVVWRYVLIFLSFIHALRFIAFSKFTNTLYEQGWTLTLQIALLWYLNPLFALNILSWPMPSVLAFMEYRIPTYFTAVLIAYMLSVMTASMAWSQHTLLDNAQGVWARVKAFLMRSQNVYDPPMWTKLAIGVYLVCIFVLDLIDACLERNHWYEASNSNVRFKRAYWSVIALLLFGGLICLVMLLYLRNYLGSKPYLESRPQQLACRVFLMIFLFTVIYAILHCLVFFFLYNSNNAVVASQQPFLQLPSLILASFFVNIMTLVYTSQNRDDNVPIDPKDYRWKYMVWPDTWYRWLARHGGSQYIFATEMEETRFYRLQFEFRKRQFMAKQKRKQAGGDGSSTVYEQPTSLGAQRVGTRSGFFSMFNTQSAASGATRRREPRAAAATARGDSDFLWRADVWETPMPSQPVSPVSSDGEGSGGGAVRDRADEGRRRLHGEPWNNRSVRFESAGAYNRARADFSDSHPGSFPRTRGTTALENTTSVSLAARSILNMDRFSTYFLADGGNGLTNTANAVTQPLSLGPSHTVSGGGCVGRTNNLVSNLTQSPHHVSSSVCDTYEVEGPARRRTRLLRGTSPARRSDNYVLRREQTTTAAENHIALSRTFAGFEGRRHLSPQREYMSTSLILGSGARGDTRHARSLSDDVQRSSRRQVNFGAERSAPRTPQMLQQQQQRRHCDPLHESPRATAVSDQDESEDGMPAGNHLNLQQSQALLEAIRQVQQDSFTSPHAPPTTTQFTVQCGEDGVGRQRTSPSPGPTSAEPRTPGQPTQPFFAFSGSVDDMTSDLSLETSGDDEDDSDNGGHGRGRRSFFRTLNVVRERIGAVMGAAERNLFEKPARNLDRFEMQIFDAAYRPFQSMHYLPFFNLETAIDCFNISWEAYGVENSVGDDAIETGIKVTPQNVPKAVAHGVKKVVCGCCPAEDDSGQDEEDSGDDSVGGNGENDDIDELVRFAREAPHHNSNNYDGHNDNRGGNEAEQRQQATPAAVPPSAGSNPAEQREMSARNLSGATVEDRDGDASLALHHETAHLSDAVVIVHMAGEGSENDAHKVELLRKGAKSQERVLEKAAKKDADAEEKAKQTTATTIGEQPSSRGPAQGGPAPTAISPTPNTPAALPDPNLFPINVEKYGFTLLLVAEAKEVQVIMVKMDTNAPEHLGKAPRIIIGFRGTANMSNAKYDMNIHRVVWREMERVAAEESDNSVDGASTDMASTLDGGSTRGTRHLGFVGCLRSCARATSWRPTCHAGFLSIWKNLRPTVMRRLCEIVREDRNIVYRVFTTGHSLGGALASLSAYSITSLLRRIDYPIPEVTVYTYGQPRMGNRTFQRLYNKAVPRSFRVVNESDVVVSMTTFGGYHVGIEVDVDRNGNFIVKPTEIEKLFPPTAGRGMAVINHLMANYGVSLNAIASRTTCPARGLECYLTADPKKIEEERAKQDALKEMPEPKRPGDANPREK